MQQAVRYLQELGKEVSKLPIDCIFSCRLNEELILLRLSIKKQRIGAAVSWQELDQASFNPLTFRLNQMIDEIQNAPDDPRA